MVDPGQGKATNTPEVECPACATLNPSTARFCQACGAPLGATPQSGGADASSETRQQYLDRMNSIKLGGGDETTTEPKKSPNGCATGCLIIVVLAVIAGIIGAISGGGDDGSSTPSSGDQYGAYDVCQQFVDDQLKAPSTSDYPSIDEASITHRGRTWDVVAYVDAENGFGANIRVPFACTVTHTGDGNYRLVDVSLVE